jgi:hypothetical protein
MVERKVIFTVALAVTLAETGSVFGETLVFEIPSAQG